MNVTVRFPCEIFLPAVPFDFARAWGAHHATYHETDFDPGRNR
jgi:hypothetical protein